jgi:chromosome segregation ATPase
MSEAYLTVLPSPPATTDQAVARIRGAAERAHSAREQLESVSRVLTDLDESLRAARGDLARARAQASADRESIARLESSIAERDALRESLRSRLAELGRALGPP